MRIYAKAAADTNITAKFGTMTVDGVALGADDRVLLIAQDDAFDNGVWEVKEMASWTRSSGAANDNELRGASVFVTEGTRYGDTAWQCVNAVPIAVSASAIDFRQIPGRHMYDNLASAAVDLGDANATITVADGKRRRLPASTLAAHRTITIVSTGAVAGDMITIGREDRSHWFLHIMLPGGAMLATLTEPGELVLFWDGTTWTTLGLRPTAGSAVFNVRAFGARGDDATDDGPAIQAALDAAGGAAKQGATGATVYVPRGRYKVSASLKIPRAGQFRMITIHGDGMDSTFIERTGTGPTFEPEARDLQPDTNVAQITTISNSPPRSEIIATSAQFITNGARAGHLAIVSGAGPNDGQWEVVSVDSETRITVNGVIPTAGPGGTVRVDNHHNGWVTIRDLAFGGPASRAFDWNFGDATNFTIGGYRPTLIMQRVTVLCGTGGTSDSAVHLFGGQGCHFTDVYGYGLSGNGGVLFHLEASSSSLFERCRIVGVPGALCRITSGAYQGISLGGGTMTLLACRGEGGIQTPEFYFEGQTVVTLIDCGGEGETSNPAQFHFVNCKDVTLINPALSTSDQPYTANKYADGLLLDACVNVRIINALVPAEFNGSGDGTARGIRIKGSCESVHVLGTRLTAVTSTDVEIESGARDCHAEIYLTSAQKPTAKGTKTYCKLNHVARVLRVNHDAGPGLPSQLCGLWVGRGRSGPAQEHQAFLAWDEGADGWKAGLDTNGDESTVARKKGFIGLNFRPYSGDNFEARSGRVNGAYDFKDSSGALQLQIIPGVSTVHVSSFTKQLILTAPSAAAELVGTAVNVNGTGAAGARLLNNGVVRVEALAKDARLTAASNGKISFVVGSHERIQLVYGGGVAQIVESQGEALELRVQAAPRIKLDPTGIGFFGAAPVAKPTIMGSKSGNAALEDLLTKLASLGLITDGTSA